MAYHVLPSITGYPATIPMKHMRIVLKLLIKPIAMARAPPEWLELTTIWTGYMPIVNDITLVYPLHDVARFGCRGGKSYDFAVYEGFGTLNT